MLILVCACYFGYFDLTVLLESCYYYCSMLHVVIAVVVILLLFVVIKSSSLYHLCIINHDSDYCDFQVQYIDA